MVRRLDDIKTVLLAQDGADFLGKLGVRVDARADSRAAQGNLAQLANSAVKPADAALNLTCVPLKFLPQPDRRRVLQVSAASLDDRHELLGFVTQRVLQPAERGLQILVNRHKRRQVNRGWDDVVAGLAHVDVVIFVNRAGIAALTAHPLVST